ncbi:hypothetical protein GOBAR_DD10989 [Gossypium barbadense]|nr:hypothetical protein GOBAR_DD10989 [Gossypium barbadense]
MVGKERVTAATQSTLISLSRVKEEDPIVVKVQGQTQANTLNYWMGRNTPLRFLMRDYCERTGAVFKYTTFHVDASTKTPHDLGMEDGDIIDANSNQSGG